MIERTLFLSKNVFVSYEPKKYEHPLTSFVLTKPSQWPVLLSTGSAQTRSQKSPVLGIYLNLSIFLISSSCITKSIQIWVKEILLHERKEISYWWDMREEWNRTFPWLDCMLLDCTCWDLRNWRGTLWSKVEVGCKLSAFVIASEHYYLIGSCYFHCEDEHENLYWKIPSVNIIS